DGRLPMDDHHTRIIVVGASFAQAQALAEGVAEDAFDNVAFFGADAVIVERALRESRERRAKEAMGLEPVPSAGPRLVQD
ncbi:MAG TPA: hypothetical protein VFI53_15720, partial [Myxococcaceae bacterium]|nr:hypothetical protein [Myxococcaceae bacterium]